MGWTTPATLVTGDVIQASWANTHVRDNSRYLKGLDGSVAIQDDLAVTGGITTTDDTGIGTSSPQAILHVYETSSGAAIVRLTNAANGSNLKNWQITIETDGDINFASVNDAWNSINSTVLTLTNAGGATISGTLAATTFSGSGASLTNLNASNLASGTVPDARLSGNVLLSSSALNSTKLTGPVLATTQTILNDGTYTICAAADGGVFFLRDDVGNFAILYLFTGPLQSEISDPFNVFTFVSGTSSSWNLYVNGADILIQNKRGATRTIEIVRIAGG